MQSCRPDLSFFPTEKADHGTSMVYATEDDGIFRTRSFWPARTVGSMEDTPFQRRWLDCLVNSPDGRIHLHPELAVSNGEAADAPLVYTRRAEPSLESSLDSPFESLAVLGGRTRRVQIIPRVPIRVSLRERFLLADQIVGDNSLEAIKYFLNAVCQVLNSGEADWFSFDDVEVGTPLWNLLAELDHAPGVAVFYPVEPQARWRLRFPAKAEDVRTRFPRKFLEIHRKRAKKFPHQLRCYREPSEVRSFLERARAVSRKSWQSKHLGLRITAAPEQQRWWERIAGLGAMRSYILEHDGKPVAFELSTQWNGTFMGDETGYDLEFARFGPGTMMFMGILEDMIARDTPRVLDFTWGNAEYKRVFSNERTVSGRVLLVRRAWKPLLAARLRQLARGISGLALAGLNRSQPLRRFLRKLRHS
jgi:hypothetical protein